MAIDINSLRKRRSDKPPRLIIYGPEKMGKTSLAASFPNPVFVQIEDGTPGDLELTSFGRLTSFSQVMEALVALYSGEHGYHTLVVDSTSALEPLVWAEVCARKSWKSIEEPGYGKGYKEADYVWQEFWDGVTALWRDRGMAIVLIAHSTIERFDDPQTQSYSRYDIDLHDRVKNLLKREVDGILLVKQDVSLLKEDTGFGKERARASGSARWIFCEGSPAFTAGNRYGMPDKLLFKQGEGFTSLSPYFPKPATDEPVAEKKDAA